ncbi:uncharacterized protein LOC132732810 [Ruditapes philippinarum]|uniref:uncharacterized protein LOC132732810 n=1 Tax=Ruditapes philippinarum TaxID=129788 RepID=UPI00295B8695|nr:uncharacterized protein LOC132732810 [Ruditapes philippinarum]
MHRIRFKVSLVFVLGFAVGIAGEPSSSEVSCQFKHGKCTYDIYLNHAEACAPSRQTTFEETNSFFKPQEIRLPADEKMTKMQKDFNVVKSDHENRIKELESSIQKVLRNAIPLQPVKYSNNHVQVESTSRHGNLIETKQPNQEGSGNILLLQLQNQFQCNKRTSLSQRTADLLETRK